MVKTRLVCSRLGSDLVTIPLAAVAISLGVAAMAGAEAEGRIRMSAGLALNATSSDLEF